MTKGGGRRHTAEQAIRKLRDIEVMLVQGRELELVLWEMDFSEQTDNRWRDKCGLMSSGEAKRPRALEAENADLKAIVADLALQNKVLKDVNSNKWWARPRSAAACHTCCASMRRWQLCRSAGHAS